MKSIHLFIAASVLLAFSCSTSQQGLFSSKTPHEKYSSGLKQAGLDATQLGKLWFTMADKSLQSPTQVSIPYKETGYFETNAPQAAGYVFTAKRGDQVTVQVSANPAKGVLLFTELWQPGENNSQPKLLAVADTVSGSIAHEITKEGSYIVRLQPELLQGVAYTITITTQPSLAFPVHKKGNPRIISVWGADRDAGARRHEGIDILAPKLTATVAAAHGTVTSVTENNLGGKVVFLRPAGKNYTLYYAHLDQQLVREGQQVQPGDTIGLVGNTGNARNTPAHLHFGIYAVGGAIDPLPFVNPARPTPKEVRGDTSTVTQYVRVQRSTPLYRSAAQTTGSLLQLAKNDIVKVHAATDQLYKVQLPDSTVGFIATTAVTSQPLQQQRLTQARSLLHLPDSTAAVKTVLASGSSITLLGTYKDYYFAEWENRQGWVQQKGKW